MSEVFGEEDHTAAVAVAQRVRTYRAARVHHERTGPLQFAAPLLLAPNLNRAAARITGSVDRGADQHDRFAGDVDRSACFTRVLVRGVDDSGELYTAIFAAVDFDGSGEDCARLGRGSRALSDAPAEGVCGGEADVSGAGVDRAFVLDCVCVVALSVCIAAYRVRNFDHDRVVEISDEHGVACRDHQGAVVDFDVPVVDDPTPDQ